MEAKAAVQLGRLATTAATVEGMRTHGQETKWHAVLSAADC